MKIKLKDLVYSHKVNKVGFVIFIQENGLLDIQHAFEYKPNKSHAENKHYMLLEQSVAKTDEVIKIQIN